MKRKDLIRYLRLHDRDLMREGARHSWWQNVAHNRRSAIPRHTEIADIPAKKSAMTSVSIHPPEHRAAQVGELADFMNRIIDA